jgi:hypothetical protein
VRTFLSPNRAACFLLKRLWINARSERRLICTCGGKQNM